MNIKEKAIYIATKAHSGQKRKDGKDYISHPLAVAKIVEETLEEVGCGESEYIVAAAILHDVIEDTCWTEDMIREELMSVAPKSQVDITISLVKVLSRDNGQSYFNFIQAIKSHKYSFFAKIIKLADIEHNLSDLPEGNLRDKYLFAQYMLLN